jgi:hypothetical protein
MIDIVEALDLLERCVRDRGDGYRSPQHGSAASRGRRHPTCSKAANRIVALALTKGGTPLTEVSRLADTPIGDAYAAGRHSLNLTLGAVVVLRAAESVERRGQTWGLALKAALGAASRFAELIPDSVGLYGPEAAAASRRSAPLARHGECRCSRRGSPA